MQDIFDAKDKLADEFNERIGRVVSAFMKKVKKAIAGIPQANGVPQFDPETLQYVSGLVPQLLKDLEASGYGEAVADLVKSEGGFIKQLRASSKIPLIFSRTAAQTISALQTTQLAAFEFIGERAINTIRDSVMRTVLTGGVLEDTLETIRESLTGKFQSYAYTYANTMLRDTMQASIDLGVKNMDLDELFWEYTGPDDDVTRPACQELLSIKVFTDAEREEWDSATADEREYNCRHAFVPISREDYEAAK